MTESETKIWRHECPACGWFLATTPLSPCPTCDCDAIEIHEHYHPKPGDLEKAQKWEEENLPPIEREPWFAIYKDQDSGQLVLASSADTKWEELPQNGMLMVIKPQAFSNGTQTVLGDYFYQFDDLRTATPNPEVILRKLPWVKFGEEVSDQVWAQVEELAKEAKRKLRGL